MNTDDMSDISLSMGPHARASYSSRMQALREYGIPPTAINRHSARAARQVRESILQGELYTNSL